MLLRKSVLFGMSATLMLSGIGRSQTPRRLAASNSAATNAQLATHRAPTLGTDMSFASIPSPLIDGWLDKEEGDAMAAAFKRAGLKSLRFSSHGLYSPRGPEATARIKAENKATNEYQWF